MWLMVCFLNKGFGEKMIIKTAQAQINNEKFMNAVELDEDPEIIQYFKKTVANLKKEAKDSQGKRIAPKADGFLYFTCIMMHAAEAAILDDNGNIKKSASGEDLNASWDIRSDGAWVWKCNDPGVLPLKNANADIFPESELKKAYKKWVGKPLCLDHKSQSVDMVRGIIVDTVYDDKHKRIIALCALDKENHPDLARKVASGYAASVSMGTAVGKAICTEKGCHRIARVESDFCDHMRNKTCYGEINVDLSPIELSIVVNGADPRAKIRRIISSANSVAQYVDKQKLAEAGITEDDALAQAYTIKDELEKLIEQLEGTGDNSSLDIDPYAQRGTGPEPGTPSVEMSAAGNTPQAMDTARFAGEMADDLNKLKEKIGELNLVINKMAYVKEHNNNKEDTVMANQKNAYFQGGGGANEPTPGQVKYPKEDSDAIRDNQDKQMNGESPFPDVGKTDGLYGDDAAKKKELLRMAQESEKRSLRRQAAMEKARELIKQRREAYFQGGGGPNEPTPGKPKYPAEDYTKTRDKEDKQMVGASPFPGVGKTDGLYGDDEKTKKLLLRAKLKARFVKASNEDGSDNLGDSQWQVYAKGDDGKSRLVLSASVNELAGPDRASRLYSGIATQEYGLKMIDVIRSEGLDTARKLFKGAQPAPAAPAAPGGLPAAPVDAGGAGELPAGEVGLEPAGETGSPVDKIRDAVRELGNLHADLEKAIEALEEENNTELGGEAVPELPAEQVATASVSLGGVRKTLNAGMRKGMKQAQAEIEDMIDELKLIQRANSDKKSAGLVAELFKEANDDINKAKQGAYKMMASFVRYAKGVENMTKTAQIEPVKPGTLPITAPRPAVLPKEPLPPATPKGPGLPEWPEEPEIEPWKDVPNYQNADDGEAVQYGIFGEEPTDTGEEPTDTSREARQDPHAIKVNQNPFTKGKSRPAGSPPPAQSIPTDQRHGNLNPNKKEYVGEMSEIGNPADDVADATATKKPDGSVDVEGSPEELKKMLGVAASKGIKNMTRQERDALRVKLAQKGLQFSDMLQKAHPGGGFTTALDVKPEGDLAEVEDLPGVNKKMVDVALAPPRKVRQAAENIQRHVIAGTIDPKTDFPALIAEGLDPAAVSYWKKLWGEAHDPEASKWVSELVKDHQSKKASANEENLKVKVARAYELAYAMAERGLVQRDPRSLRQQADKILNCSDESFTYLQETVSKIPVKKASIPDVGVQESSVITATDYLNPPLRSEGEDLKAQFDLAFAGRKY